MNMPKLHPKAFALGATAAAIVDPKIHAIERLDATAKNATVNPADDGS